MISRIHIFCTVVMLVFAGCISGIPPDSTTTSEKKAFPERPKNLTNESVQSFVESYEKKKVLNGYSSSGSSVSCESYVESEGKSAHVAYVQCMGGIELSEGNHVDVTTWSFYYVSNQTTKRSSIDNATSRNYQRGTSGKTGIQILNFDSVPHKATLIGKNRINNEMRRINLSYNLQPGELVIQNYLPYKYNMSYKLEYNIADETGSFLLSPRQQGTRIGHSETILILPDGSIRFMNIPPYIDEVTTENEETNSTTRDIP